MTTSTPLAGRASNLLTREEAKAFARDPLGLNALLGRSFTFDLQMFAEDDDDDPTPIDIGSLSDDPAQLKSLIRQQIADNRAVRRRDRNRRTENDTLKTKIATMEREHKDALAAARAEGKSEFDAQVARLTNEHKAALDAVVAERDGLKTEFETLKGQNETLTRSNGQLRGRARDLSITTRARNEFEKRVGLSPNDPDDVKAKKTAAVEAAMRLFDPDKVEFDDEKGDLKDPAGFTSRLEEFGKANDFLFAAFQTQTQSPTFNRARGTSPGRGASDNPNPGNSGGKKTDFSDENRSIDDLALAVLREEAII